MGLTDDVVGHPAEHRVLRAHTREYIDFHGRGVYTKLVCRAYTLPHEVLNGLISDVWLDPFGLSWVIVGGKCYVWLLSVGGLHLCRY